MTAEDEARVREIVREELRAAAPDVEGMLRAAFVRVIDEEMSAPPEGITAPTSSGCRGQGAPLEAQQ